MDSSNKSICSYLWSSACIRHDGRLLPCCRYDDFAPSVHVQDYSHNIEKAYNSSIYKEMRTKALRGEKNKGCEGCYFVEKETGNSLRHRANEEFREEFNNDYSSLSNITYLEVFVGNVCNLKCQMCDPTLSVSLATDYVKMGMGAESLLKPYQNDHRALVAQLVNLQRLKFVGGEPLLSKTHWDLLASISPERAKGLRLEYATNCTIFPNTAQLELWEKFASLEIILSIDGAGLVNDYARFPSRWQIVEKNAKKFRELTKNPRHAFGINTVVSRLNIFDLEPLNKWVSNYLEGPGGDEPVDHIFTHLTYPPYLDIQNLPDEVKNEILQKYPDNRHYNFVKAVLKNKREPSQMSEFKEKTLNFDKIRKINYMNFIPALKRIMEFSE